MDNMFGNMFNGMFRPVRPGCAKLGVNGKIAIKTSTGYKTFDVASRKLTNCDNFAFDMDNMFWIIPTMKVEPGDIVIINAKPHAVLEANSNSIKAFSYEDSTIVEVVPEHHYFMGKAYCYGKIFSPYMGFMKNDGGMSKLMNMMMVSQMFNSKSSANMNPMMFMMMGNNGFDNMFDGAFELGTEENGNSQKEE